MKKEHWLTSRERLGGGRVCRGVREELDRILDPICCGLSSRWCDRLRKMTTNSKKIVYGSVCNFLHVNGGNKSVYRLLID